MQRNRESFLPLFTLIVLSLSPWPDGGAVAQAPKVTPSGQGASLEELRRARFETAHRHRRIIFNNDGNEPILYCDQATAEAVLRPRTLDLANTQVDTIYYCTWSSGFGIFTHNTRIGEVFTSKDDPPAKDNKSGGFSRNITGDLLAQGTDPLRIMVQWCRAHGKEVFWSFRMNDTHDAGSNWYAPYHFPKLKRDHPDWLVGTINDKPKHGRWTSVDYGRPEIRDLAFRFTEEVCQSYDIDGIELDFLRHATFFKRPATGIDAGQEELDQMTGLVRHIRAMTEKEGRKRGRAILVSIRVYDSVDACRAIGLDVARWLEEGLVDLMAVSDYFRLNPWETSVELGHKHAVPVYACLSDTRLKDDEARKIRASVEGYRGRASEAWEAGVDGIYLFNYFNPKSPLWSELGDRQALKTMDKVYTTSARGVSSLKYWLRDGERFSNRKIVSPERPATLKPGQTAAWELHVGQESTEAKPAMTLRLRTAGAGVTARLTVRLNDQPLDTGQGSDRWIEYQVAPQRVRPGVNRITIALADEQAPVRLEDLVLGVYYRKGS